MQNENIGPLVKNCVENLKMATKPVQVPAQLVTAREGGLSRGENIEEIRQRKIFCKNINAIQKQRLY